VYCWWNHYCSRSCGLPDLIYWRVCVLVNGKLAQFKLPSYNPSKTHLKGFETSY